MSITDGHRLRIHQLEYIMIQEVRTDLRVPTRVCTSAYKNGIHLTSSVSSHRPAPDQQHARRHVERAGGKQARQHVPADEAREHRAREPAAQVREQHEQREREARAALVRAWRARRAPRRDKHEQRVVLRVAADVRVHLVHGERRVLVQDAARAAGGREREVRERVRRAEDERRGVERECPVERVQEDVCA
jgi:type IV secretory pathway VirB10-like protein